MSLIPNRLALLEDIYIDDVVATMAAWYLPCRA